MSISCHRIYTIGTSNRTLEEFKELLKYYGISVIIDVRRFPRSRFSHFTREGMEALLKDTEYIWLGDLLGGYRGGYEAYMETEGFSEGIERIENISRKCQVALVCSERLPWRCHRRFIGRVLSERGWMVLHIVQKEKTWTSPDEKVGYVVHILSKRYKTEDTKRDPFYVLITTLLSQRTKDEVTDLAAKRLFERFRDPKELASADIEEIEDTIKPVGFYKQKARRIKEVAEILKDKGVPEDIDGLLKLPGVGRKTANCVLVYGFRKSAIPVDTHVHRICNRLKIVKTESTKETEDALRRNIPERYWLNLNKLLVSFGKDICRPINPRCTECPIFDMCKNMILEWTKR
jgi:endonuclease-3